MAMCEFAARSRRMAAWRRDLAFLKISPAELNRKEGERSNELSTCYLVMYSVFLDRHTVLHIVETVVSY